MFYLGQKIKGGETSPELIKDRLPFYKNVMKHYAYCQPAMQMAYMQVKNHSRCNQVFSKRLYNWELH